MNKKILFIFTCLFAAILLLVTCGNNTEIGWPESPLYDAPEDDPFWDPPSSVQEAKEALQGHYAHYDIVAYEEMQDTGPMRTFIISYGFTDLYLEGDALIERDEFCSASYKMNQSNTKLVSKLIVKPIGYLSKKIYKIFPKGKTVPYDMSIYSYFNKSDILFLSHYGLKVLFSRPFRDLLKGYVIVENIKEFSVDFNYLSKIDFPTFILSGSKDEFFPVDIQKKMNNSS